MHYQYFIHMRDELVKKLTGGDLRSIGEANAVVDEIKDQSDFDALFACLHLDDRLVIMRAADAIEKITVKRSDFLSGHKEELFTFCRSADNSEFKWHLALLLPRLSLSRDEFADAWEILSSWLCDPKESKIVRVNSMQALFELSKQDEAARERFDSILLEVEMEKIPSLLARIRKIRRT